MKESRLTLFAKLIGDPSRAFMLFALYEHKHLTAGELAKLAGVTPQTATAHLEKLCEGGLLNRKKIGRQKVFWLASDEIEDFVKAFVELAGLTEHDLKRHIEPKQSPLKGVSCYAHLGGALGIWLYERMRAQEWLAFEGQLLFPTLKGREQFHRLGIDCDALEGLKSQLCLECYGQSHQSPHLAGSLGRSLLSMMLASGWVAQKAASREVQLRAKGRQEIERLWGPLEDAPTG